MVETIKKLAGGAVVTLSVPLLLASPFANAASTVTVTGNTAAAENQPGWMFNRDASTDTPYEFNDDEASIGAGSLYVLPIGANPADKFIAENFLQTAVADVDSISYDFLIAGNGDTTDAGQFYLNVYANLPGSPANNFYDCRFDYAPTTGSTTDFTTFSVEPTDTPVFVKPRPAATVCPATLAGMPAGSVIRAFSISVGDTTASDTGLAGYLDNVVVATSADTVTYDFEPVISVSNKEGCKDGGWATSNTPVYKNQGECVSSFASKNK